MGDSKKPARDPIAALLTLLEDVDETPEEAEKELRNMGIDVDGFLARMKARRGRREEAKRTAWLQDARTELSRAPRATSSKYGTMSHVQLVAEYQRRQQAQAYFHKLEGINDDDLRTLLMDLDDLDNGQKDPT